MKQHLARTDTSGVDPGRRAHDSALALDTPSVPRPGRFATAVQDTDVICRLIDDFHDSGERVVAALARNQYDAAARRYGAERFADAVASFLVQDASVPLGADSWDMREVWPGGFGVLQRVWRNADRVSRNLVTRLTPEAPRLPRAWTLIGIVIATAAATAAYHGAFIAAAALIAARVGGSIRAGSAHGMCIPRGRIKVVRCRSMWDDLYECLSSHLCHLLVLGGVGLHLAERGADGAAAFAYATVVASLYASLARAGAQRAGAMIPRSPLEPMVRNGAAALSLAAAAVVPNSAIVPALVLIPGGYAMYALAELARVIVVTRVEPPPDSAMTVARTANGTARIDGFRIEGTPGRRLALVDGGTWP